MAPTWAGPGLLQVPPVLYSTKSPNQCSRYTQPELGLHFEFGGELRHCENQC